MTRSADAEAERAVYGDKQPPDVLDVDRAPKCKGPVEEEKDRMAGVLDNFDLVRRRLASPLRERMMKSFSVNLSGIRVPNLDAWSRRIQSSFSAFAFPAQTVDPSGFARLAVASEANFPTIEYPDFGRHAANLFRGMDFDELRRVAARVHPRNLRGAYGIDDEVLWQIMVDEGIPFFLVPDEASIAELRSKADASSRRAVLIVRAEQILQQCEAILLEVNDVDASFYAEKIGEAIAVFRGGGASAAQALATNVLDSTLQDYGKLTHRDFVTGKQTAQGALTRDAYVADLPYVEAIALAPLVKVHEADKRPDPPKVGYTRHGTIHRVTREQYTEANAVQAIMLATSVLGFVQGLW